MEWKQLLSSKTVLGNDGELSQNITSDDVRSFYLKDVDRIIYSSHFRKLQDKTQVYPLSRSDYVRTRLTHSLEVGTVGRSLGFYVGRKIIEKYELKSITEHDFGYILQAACVAHDIGNPPFGHLGEEAITTFFKTKVADFQAHLDVYNNVISFDGNSQGFRIITNLAGWAEKGGLRLTCATLGTFCKYPRSFVQNAVMQRLDTTKSIGTAKCGILSSEIPIMESISKELGLIRLIKGETIFYRHPLAFLVEAADDICYCVADTEDAFFVNLISFKEVEKLLAPIARSPHKYEGDAGQRIADLKKEHFYKGMDDRKKVEWLRGKSISNLIEATQEVFLQNEEDILKGKFNSELLTSTHFSSEIKECKKFARENIYNASDKINSEITGIEVITGVLDELYRAMNDPKHPKSKRIINLLKVTDIDHKNFSDKITFIIDTVSDFTDKGIVALYKVLKGI